MIKPHRQVAKPLGTTHGSGLALIKNVVTLTKNECDEASSPGPGEEASTYSLHAVNTCKLKLFLRCSLGSPYSVDSAALLSCLRCSLGSLG